MFCKGCGKNLPDDAKFCLECGCPVEVKEEILENTAEEADCLLSEASDTEKAANEFDDEGYRLYVLKRKKKRNLIVGVSITLAVILIVSCIIFIPQYIEKKKEEEIHNIVIDLSVECLEGNYEKAKEIARKLPDNDKVESYIGVIEFYEELDGWSGSSEALFEIFADYCAKAENWSFYYPGSICSINGKNCSTLDAGMDSSDFKKINTQLIPGLRKEYDVALELDLVVNNFCNNLMLATTYPKSVDLNQLYYSTLKELNSLNTQDGIYTVERAISNVEQIADEHKEIPNILVLDRVNLDITTNDILYEISFTERYGYEIHSIEYKESDKLSPTTYALVYFIERLIRSDIEFEIVDDSGSREFSEIFGDVYKECYPE